MEANKFRAYGILRYFLMKSQDCIQQVNKIMLEDSVVSTQSGLYNKYSSSQTYFYTKKISDIVKEKRTSYNITYEDIECFAEDDEYLKRFYQLDEHERKMFAFKQYYFYHEDCPRIFIKNIQLIYEKWQDKKRDLVYKKLKFLYNESYSSQDSTEKSNEEDLPPVSHFLLNISQFNPYSKKYYLRVLARKEKEEEKRKKQNEKIKTKIQLEGLNHELSVMLADMSILSAISTLNNETAKSPTLFKKSSQKKQQSKQLSRNNPVKLNFKKNKETPLHQVRNVKNMKLIDRRQSMRAFSIPENKINISPKMAINKIDGLDNLKTKSIFSISSFGINKPVEQKQTKKKFDLGLGSKELPKKANKNYESQKVIKIKDLGEKSKSTSKMLFKDDLNKIKAKPFSLKEVNYNFNAFSDKKLQVKGEIRVSDKLRSSGSVYSTYSSATMGKKNSFKIRESSNGKK